MVPIDFHLRFGVFYGVGLFDWRSNHGDSFAAGVHGTAMRRNVDALG
ncbi:hypothetical protein X753_21315 [Mesorhizobium sp. LNJC399B00]|nr:hypothetical protein X753_21315 [Mesorhizobium sp. LNJC399B00]